MKQGIDHCGEEEMAPLSPTDRRNQRRMLSIVRVVVMPWRNSLQCTAQLGLQDKRRDFKGFELELSKGLALGSYHRPICLSRIYYKL